MKHLIPTLLLIGALLQTAFAQTWVGDQDADWFTDNAGDTNWSADAIPNGIGSSVVFDATSTTPNPLSITVGSNVTVGDFTYTGAPSAITLSGAGVITMDDAGGSNNFLAGSGAVDFTIENNMVFTSGQSSVINFNSTGVINLNGNISGVAGLRQNNGQGTINLAGDNSYQGPTYIDRGNVAITSGTALGSGAINWRVAGGSAANLVVNSDATIGNALVLVDNGGGASNRIRTASGVTATFTTNSVTADAGEVLELNTVSGPGTYRFTGTSLTTDVAVNIINSNNTLELSPASGTQTWSGVIEGGGLVEKTGAGTAVLSGNNTYTSITTVSAGTLIIDGTTSGQGQYTVASGATLGGSGTIGTLDSDVIINGILSPGNSPGTLTMDLGTGNLDVSGAESLVFELGTSSDLVSLTTGTLELGTGAIGFSDFAFSDSGGLTNGQYVLFDTGSAISGTLNGADLSGSIGSLTGTLEVINGGQDLALNVIPEPSTLILVGLALGTLVFFRRKA
jgi:autotransporter-associated beta strand protein